MVVAQLVERSPQTPEIHGSNADIGKSLSTNCTIDKTEINKKRPGKNTLVRPSKFLESETLTYMTCDTNI